jgi:hypothetical protein
MHNKPPVLTLDLIPENEKLIRALIRRIRNDFLFFSKGIEFVYRSEVERSEIE